ncbi:Flagellar M-ring protein [Alphaproteobacteria bacterium SO-S41]|nr:Flagellar M-ring protein [Alphaproteobacteria bacterium SO-S41]
MGWRLAAIAGVTLAAAALLFWLATQATKTPMGLLFSGLDPRDSAAVVERLDAANVPYELKGDGTTILVPQDQALKLRMTMASAGLPAGGGVGYEIFDNQDALGVTSFQQNVNRLRALEGELARTIRSLDRIEQARVHLVIPERKLFTDAAAQPTASIVIRTRGGRLAPEQVQAIQNLVAGAVEGLTVQRVSVVDEKGELLAGGEGDNSTAATQSALDARKASYEERIRRQVESIVASVVGVGQTRVEVSADLDFNRRIREKTTYDPDGQVVRSTSTRSSNADATNSEGANAVSVATNLPSEQDPAAADGQDKSREVNTQSDETTNYEISSTKETETQEGGAVKRLSVAVAVDGVWTTSSEGARTYAPRSDDDMKKIESLVRSAVGFDEKRGDALQVVNVQFAQEDAQTLTPEEEPFLGLEKSDIMKLIELAVMIVIALLAILLVFRPLMARLLSPISFNGGTPQLAGPGMAALNPPGSPALPAPDGSFPALPVPRGDAEKMIDIARVDGQVSASSVKKVGEIVHKHPEEAVSIMRQWLHESA